MKFNMNLNVKQSKIISASSNVKVAYKNLENYDKGIYNVSNESYKQIEKKVARIHARRAEQNS